jgi:hypothetical protein
MQKHSTAGQNRKTESRPLEPGHLAILSTRNETRVVRIKGRAADICYDWKVEVLGSPAWMIDARSNRPALTQLGLASSNSLKSIGVEVEVAYHG